MSEQSFGHRPIADLVGALGVRSLLVATLAAAAVVCGRPAQAAEEPTSLRVVSFNVWGIWGITPSRAARIAAIGPAVAALRPDLVALQEVWLQEDADRLQSDLAAAGLVHSRRFGGGWHGNSGLVIASRFPIESTEFVEYAQGSHPHVPWHVDWVAGKGIARVRIMTPAGPVDFANTHLQAAYGTKNYEFVQLSQLLQAADFLVRADDAPLIVAGDLNVPCRSALYRAFSLRVGLTPTNPACGIDSISHRTGRTAATRTAFVQDALAEPMQLADGLVMPLSDHRAVLADIEIAPGAGSLVFADASEWIAVVRETLPRVHAQERLLAQSQMQSGVLSFLLMQAALLLYLARRRRLPVRIPRRLPAGPLAVAALMTATWFLYLGVGYAPKHIDDLDGIRRQLEAPLQAAMYSGRRLDLTPPRLNR